MIYVTPPTPYLAPTSLDSSTCNNGLPVVRVETVRVRGEAQKASLVVQVGGLFSSTLQHEDCSSHSGNGLPGERCPYEASAARRSLASSPLANFSDKFQPQLLSLRPSFHHGWQEYAPNRPYLTPVGEASRLYSLNLVRLCHPKRGRNFWLKPRGNCHMEWLWFSQTSKCKLIANATRAILCPSRGYYDAV